VPQRDLSPIATSFEADGYDRLQTLGGLGHPGVFHMVRPFDPNESPVMGPSSSFVLYCDIKKAVHNRVYDFSVCTKPWASGTVGVHLYLEYILNSRGDGARDGQINNVHLGLSCFAMKKLSNRSRRSFQNRS
jgi:hypothetical protein